MTSEILLGLAWLLYGAIHSILASNTIKKIFATKYYRLIYNALAIVLLVPIVFFQFKINSENLLPSSSFNLVLGGIMMFSGVYLVFIALKNYDTQEFLGTDFKQDKKKIFLQTDGLSSVVRHPLYLGLLLLVWGNFGFFGKESHLISAIALSVYIRIGIYFEEKKLVQDFGKAYEKYQKEVPMLIPKF
jgi:methanethiol S-methyltransferase